MESAAYLPPHVALLAPCSNSLCVVCRHFIQRCWHCLGEARREQEGEEAVVWYDFLDNFSVTFGFLGDLVQSELVLVQSGYVDVFANGLLGLAALSRFRWGPLA